MNLSSNELRHLRVGPLLAELFDGIDLAAAHRYPAIEEPVRALAVLIERDVNDILVTAGSDAAIRVVLAVLHGAYGGRLLLQEPNYDAWTHARESPFWSIHKVGHDHRSAGPLDEITRAAAQSTRSVVAISWPNGPAGYTPQLADVAALSRVCAENGHLLIVDACYSGFADGFPAVFDLAGPSCLVVVSWSKLFGLAGARAAVTVGPPFILRMLGETACEHQVSWIALHALARTGVVLAQFQQVWRDIRNERDALRQRLLGAGVQVPASGGNFLHLRFGDGAQASAVTDEASRLGYRLRNMGATADLENCVRFTVGCDADSRRFREDVLPSLLDLSAAL